ncbi:MAG: hypothetical protein K6E29_06430 [Cyanobacteria bacterium RUI128]|nr:hypothetical protein [Cyanobacteria bacterium RUI128]
MNVAKVMGLGAEIQKPKKQTYKAMYKYSKAISDKDSAKMFKTLDNQARARLHAKKSADAQQRIFDLSEEMSEEGMSFKEKVGYFAKQARNTFEYIKETVISKYYALRAKTI